MRRAAMMNGGYEENAEFGHDNDENDLGAINDYSEAQGPISQWINRAEVRQFIRRKFSRFLRNYTEEPDNRHVYEDRIHEMCQHNR